MAENLIGKKAWGGQRILSYDLVRIAAFGMIVLFHVCCAAFDKLGGGTNVHNWPLGAFGVSLFVVLSGCSLGISDEDVSVCKFYKKRFAAYMPSYWMAYVCVFLFLFIFAGRMGINAGPWRLGWTLIGMDGWLNSRVHTYYLEGEWFTGFILLVYLLAPFLIMGVRRYPLPTLVLTLLLSYLTIRFHSDLYAHIWLMNQRPLWNPTARLFEFSYGIAISMYLIHRRKRIFISGAVAAVILAGLAISGQDLFQFTFLGTIIGVLSMLVLLALFETVSLSGESLAVVRFLSKYSFMGFLLHHQITYWLVGRVHYGRLDDTFILMTTLSTLALSYTAGYFVEKPASVLRAWLKNRLLGSLPKG